MKAHPSDSGSEEQFGRAQPANEALSMSNVGTVSDSSGRIEVVRYTTGYCYFITTRWLY